MSEELAGGISYDENGTPLTDQVLYKAMDSDAVLLGAVGGPKWDNLEFFKKTRKSTSQIEKRNEIICKFKTRYLFF